MIVFNRFTFLISVILLVVLQLLIINSIHDWGDDFSLYLHQAESIQNGTLEQLEQTNIEMMNHGKIGPYLYPVGFPFLLSFFDFSNPFNLVQFKLLGIILFCLCLILISTIFQFFINPNTSRKLALIFGLQPYFFFQAHNILSDIPALFFALLSFALYLNLSKRQNSNKQEIFIIIVFLISSNVMFLIRSNYYFLLIGFIAFNSIKLWIESKVQNTHPVTLTKIRNLILISFTSIAIHIIVKKNFLTGNGSNEASELLFLFKHPRILSSTIYNNIQYYLGMFSFGFFKPTKLQTIWISLFAISTIWKFRTTLINFRNYNNLHLIELTFYNICSLCIYLIWPYQQGERFVFFNLILIIPLIYHILLTFLEPLWNFQSRNLCYIYFILHFFIIYRGHISGILKNPEGSPGTRSFINAMTYIQKNSDSNSIILSNKPRATHFFSKRKSYLISEENLNAWQQGNSRLIFTRDTQEQSILLSNGKSWTIKRVFYQAPLAIYKQF